MFTLLQPFWLDLMPLISPFPFWPGWAKAGYVAVCFVNVITAAVLFPREADLSCQEKRQHFELVVDRLSFLCLQLASCGAGCAAAFLGKRAGTSSHGRTVCAIGIINWIEILGCFHDFVSRCASLQMGRPSRSF